MLARRAPLASMSTATAAPYQPLGRLMVTLACPRETGTTVDAASLVTQAASPSDINNTTAPNARLMQRTLESEKPSCNQKLVSIENNRAPVARKHRATPASGS